MPSQKEGLGHVTEGFFHSLVSNLDHMPKDPRYNLCGKGKEVALFRWPGLLKHPGIDLALSCVIGPIFKGGGMC
jgi:hypothetical protein